MTGFESGGSAITPNFVNTTLSNSESINYNKLGPAVRLKAWFNYKFSGLWKSPEGKAEALFNSMHDEVQKINSNLRADNPEVQLQRSAALAKIAEQYGRALGAGRKVLTTAYYEKFKTLAEADMLINSIALPIIISHPASFAPSSTETATAGGPPPPPLPPMPPSKPQAPSEARGALLKDIRERHTPKPTQPKQASAEPSTAQPPGAPPPPPPPPGSMKPGRIPTEIPQPSASILPPGEKAKGAEKPRMGKPMVASGVAEQLAAALAKRGVAEGGPTPISPKPSEEKPAIKPAISEKEETEEEKEARIKAAAAKAAAAKEEAEAAAKLPPEAPLRRLTAPKWGPQFATPKQTADLQYFSFPTGTKNEQKAESIVKNLHALELMDETVKKEYFRAAKSILIANDPELLKIVYAKFDKKNYPMNFLFLVDTLLKGDGIVVQQRGAGNFTAQRRETIQATAHNLVRKLREESPVVRNYIDDNKTDPKVADLYKEYCKPVVPPPRTKSPEGEGEWQP